MVVEGLGISDLKDSAADADISAYKGSAPDWLARALPRTCLSLLPIAFEITPASSSPVLDILQMPTAAWDIAESGELV